MNRTGRLLLFGFALLVGAAAPKPPAAIRILDSDVDVDYPAEFTFSIEAESDVTIQTVELEFGLIGRDCTPDVNIMTPEDFEPSGRIDAAWTWETTSLGVLPPGMRIWWRWRLVDAAGGEVRTEKDWMVWIDDVHDWKVLQSGNILLYWYRGTEAYNREFLQAAEAARDLLRKDVGTWPDLDIRVYLYGSNRDLKEALEGEPEWIGGLSFDANQRTIMIGIDPGNEAWGKATISHELAHTAVDSIMGGCWASIPLWLNEGIAMYAEGEQEAVYGEALVDAIYYDRLFSLRSISDEYQMVEGDPILTYAESYSVVSFMIGEYGQEEIRRLLQTLGRGYSYDYSLIDALGVDMDGLEEAWRKAIGADPMQKSSAAAPTLAMPESTLPPSILSLAESTPMPTPTAPAAVAADAETEDPTRTVFSEFWMAVCLLMGICLTGLGSAVVLIACVRGARSAADPRRRA
ncbi:MAG: hypothetical protein JW929_11740 [Anaerolineales bacterium]|nr:hypothetical protein [Anaerolineales bacterium]